MNPKFITWFETLLYVVLDGLAERMMLIFPVPQPIRVEQPIMARPPHRARWGQGVPVNQAASRPGVRLRADGRENCSLPTGV